MVQPIWTLLQTESKHVLFSAFCGSDGHQQAVAMQPASCTLPSTGSVVGYPATFTVIWKYDQRRYHGEATIRQHKLTLLHFIGRIAKDRVVPLVYSAGEFLPTDLRSLRSQTCRRHQPGGRLTQDLVSQRFGLAVQVTSWSLIDQRSCSTPRSVSAWMGDRLQAGKPSRFVADADVDSAFYPPGVGKKQNSLTNNNNTTVLCSTSVSASGLMIITVNADGKMWFTDCLQRGGGGRRRLDWSMCIQSGPKKLYSSSFILQ